jgi:hypothetical protein
VVAPPEPGRIDRPIHPVARVQLVGMLFAAVFAHYLSVSLGKDRLRRWEYGAVFVVQGAFLGVIAAPLGRIVGVAPLPIMAPLVVLLLACGALGVAGALVLCGAMQRGWRRWRSHARNADDGPRNHAPAP